MLTWFILLRREKAWILELNHWNNKNVVISVRDLKKKQNAMPATCTCRLNSNTSLLLHGTKSIGLLHGYLLKDILCNLVTREVSFIVFPCFVVCTTHPLCVHTLAVIGVVQNIQGYIMLWSPFVCVLFLLMTKQGEIANHWFNHTV